MPVAAVIDLTGAEDRVLETLHSVDAQRGAIVEILGYSRSAPHRIMRRWNALDRAPIAHCLSLREAVERASADHVILLTGGELLASDAVRSVMAAIAEAADVIVGEQVLFHPDGSAALGARRIGPAEPIDNRALVMRRDLVARALKTAAAYPDPADVIGRTLALASASVTVGAVLVARRHDGAGGECDRTATVLAELRRIQASTLIDVEAVRALVRRWSSGAVIPDDSRSIGAALRNLLAAAPEAPALSFLSAVAELLAGADVEAARVLLGTGREPQTGPAAELRAMAARLRHGDRSDGACSDRAGEEAVRLLGAADLTSSRDARAWEALAVSLAERCPRRAVEVPGMARADLRRARRMRATGVLTHGRSFRVTVSSADQSALPVLYDTISAKPIAPREIRASAGEAGGAGMAERSTRTACFSLRDIPVGHALVPAAVDAAGLITGVPFRGTVPPYRPGHSMLIDDHGGLLVLERRRHWLLRAPRSLIRRIRERRLA